MKSGKTRLNVRNEEKRGKGGKEGENERRVEKHPNFPLYRNADLNI